MHPQAKGFMDYVHASFPGFFGGDIAVLDVGSGDINGNNRYLFADSCSYQGNDVVQAPNVTVVCKTSALPFPDGMFRTIVSTECFEHDPEYVASLQAIVRMLQPGGLFAFTCASTGRPEHGTRRTTPYDSYATLGEVHGWTDYYKNLTLDDLRGALDLDGLFSAWAAYYNATCCDLYFWGIRRGPDPLPALPAAYQVLGAHRWV